MIRLLAHTGLRRLELVALRWSNVDAERNSILSEEVRLRRRPGWHDHGGTVIDWPINLSRYFIEAQLIA